MLTKTPLKQLMNESAKMHSDLNCRDRQQARQNIVAVSEALKLRHSYNGKYKHLLTQ